jgi:carboxyl-terminal processing protease
MRRKEELWWISATVLSLAALSFFAGLGLRGLFSRLTPGELVSGDPRGNYPKLASADPRVGDPDMRPAVLFDEVMKKLRIYYVEPLPSGTQLAQGSVEAMLNSLNDPNTRLLSKTEVDALQGALEGQFQGLGAVLTIRRHNTGKADEADAPGQPEGGSGVKTLTVVTVAPGSPAEKAGLEPGDRITELDGHWIAPAHLSYRLITQLTDPLGPQDLRPPSPDDPPATVKPDPEREKARKEADEARARWKNATDLFSAMKDLMGGAQGEHELTVERGTPSKTLKVKVTLRPTEVTLFSSRKLNATTGYLQIFALNDSTPRQVSEALADFQKSGIKNLVVDLRHSAGGSLDAAREVAGILMGEVKFAVVKERDAARKLVERPVLARANGIRLKPAAASVLVDGGTAGSSELLAAALRDHLHARLVGTTTFGDGSEQELVRMDNGVGISITRGRMLTSKGGDFDGKGLKADVAPEGDPIEAAVKALSNAAPARGKRAGYPRVPASRVDG